MQEQEIMDDLLKHYGPLMRYIIAPIVKNPQDQEDCLSEVITRVWEKSEQFDEERGSRKAIPRRKVGNGFQIICVRAMATATRWVPAARCRGNSPRYPSPCRPEE